MSCVLYLRLDMLLSQRGVTDKPDATTAATVTLWCCQTNVQVRLISTKRLLGWMLVWNWNQPTRPKTLSIPLSVSLSLCNNHVLQLCPSAVRYSTSPSPCAGCGSGCLSVSLTLTPSRFAVLQHALCTIPPLSTYTIHKFLCKLAFWRPLSRTPRRRSCSQHTTVLFAYARAHFDPRFMLFSVRVFACVVYECYCAHMDRDYVTYVWYVYAYVVRECRAIVRQFGGWGWWVIMWRFVPLCAIWTESFRYQFKSRYER